MGISEIYFQRSCGDVACEQMDDRSNCVQFYVNEEKLLNPQNSSKISSDLPSRSFVLHLDEVDVIGICQSQMH